jgi:uncharacterized protein (DUF4415 family)
MPTAKKPTSTSSHFSDEQIAAAKAAASRESTGTTEFDWDSATLTPGGGVAATIEALRRVRGPGRKPAKEQVAIRLDRDVLGAFRSGGPGWQTRVNAALKEWLAARSKPRSRRQGDA